MGAKQNKCCCCPVCTADPGVCCRCIPTTICVTFTQYPDTECRVELDWDSVNRNFAGSVTCLGEAIDLLFYFERDEYGCWFKLRSDALGYPEGYESQVPVGNGEGEIPCADLCYDWGSVTAGDESFTMTTVAVQKIKRATDCTGCECFCKCLCVTVTRPDGRRLTGIVCWCHIRNGYSRVADDLTPLTECLPDDSNCDTNTPDYHGWVGTLSDPDGYLDDVEVCFELGPRNRYDVTTPADESCVIALGCNHYDPTDAAFELLPDCGIGLIEATFTITEYNEDYYSYLGPAGTTVAVTCAVCNVACDDTVTCKICEELALPRTLTVSIYRSSSQTTCENLEFVDSFEITNPGPPDPTDEDCWQGSHVYTEPGSSATLTATFCCAHPGNPTASWNMAIQVESDTTSEIVELDELTCDPFLIRNSLEVGSQFFGPDTPMYCMFISL